MGDSVKKINVFFTFFQVCGLQYFSAQELWSKKVHPKFKIYFIVLVFLIIATFLGQMLTGSEVIEDDSTKRAVSQNVSDIPNFGLYLTSFIIILQSLIKTSKNKEIFQNFDKIAELSRQKVFYAIDYKSFKKQFMNKLFGLSIVFIVPLFFGSYMDYTKVHINGAAPFFRILPTLVVELVSIKFMFYADLINFHLKAIGYILTQPKDQIIKLSDIFDRFNVQKLRNSCNFVERITVAKKIYGLIWECTELVNECMGPTVLMIFILTTVGLISVTYFIFVLIQQQCPIVMFSGKTYILTFCNKTKV